MPALLGLGPSPDDPADDFVCCSSLARAAPELQPARPGLGAGARLRHTASEIEAHTLLHLGGKASLAPPVVATQPIVPRAPATLDAVILPCLHVSVERRPDLALPRTVLRPNQEVITESEIEVVLPMLDRTLRRGEPFTVLLDLRTTRLPSRKALQFGLEWMARPQIAAPLDELVASISLVIESPVVRAMPGWGLSVCKPPHPVHFLSSPEAADEPTRRDEAAAGHAPPVL